MKRLALVLFSLAACKSATSAAPPPRSAAEPGAAWQALVDAPDRSAQDRALDPGRHPAAMLAFLDLRPGMRVADLGAGGGYTTELIARAIGPSGVVYMQNEPSWLPFLKDAIAERMTHPAMKNAVRADIPFGDVLPPEAKDLDEVVMNVVYHDVANLPVDRVRMHRLVFNALKPGGRFIVIDSSAKPGSGLSATATLHRIDEEVVKDEVQKAGFRLVAEGSFLRNPADARDWNSSPGAAAKAGLRGQSDRFALAFVRPEGTAQQIVPPRLRLPPGVRPVRYAAELSIDPESDQLDGSGELEVAADAPTPILWLDAEELKILAVEPQAQVIDAQPGFVGLQFAQPLPAGKSTIKLRWQGTVSRREQQGLYRQQENGAWYVLSQGEPLGMRRALPCFDEPSFKIPWRIALRVPKAATAYFNTPVEATEDAGGRKLVRFAETRPLPSYLLAFGVGPFERVDAGKARGGQPIGVVVTRGKTAWAKYSAKSSPAILRVLEDYFQVPYHYPKLDLIEVPLGGGAMENPGLITFAQRINLAKPGQETPSFLRRAASVEAHEFAHLWFGDMVTTAWWDDLWLNEAFATWMTFHAIEKFAPSWGTPAERADSLLRAMYSDRLLSARRIRQPIQSEGDIKTAFDGITYQKGAAVIRMFEQYVGEDVFRRGVQSYLKEFADEGATARHFLGSISAAAGKNVSPSFSTFLDQAGLPLVTARLSCEGGKGTLSLEQSRYLPLGAAQTPPPEQTWQIPVCARTDQGRACTLLAQKSGTLDLGSCPRWVMPNAGASGYYRTALDDEQLGKLTQNTATLTSPEKMLFFSDVFAASQAGAVEFPRAFELARSLAADKDRHVVQGLFPAVEYPDARGFVSDGLRPKYAAWVRDTFGRRARALGFAERKGEGDDARILRPPLLELVGDQGEDPALRAQARKVADRWLADHRTTSPELASAALFLSAIAGDQAFYEKLHAAAKKEPVRVERQRILQAMGEFRDPKLVQQGLQIALSDEFDPRESILLMWGAASDPRTREAALQFVEENFDKIVKRMPRDYGAGLVNAGSGFCDDAHAQALDKFFRPRSRLYPGGDRRFAQALEQVRQCAAFRARAEPALTAWLEKRSPQALRSR